MDDLASKVSSHPEDFVQLCERYGVYVPERIEYLSPWIQLRNFPIPMAVTSHWANDYPPYDEKRKHVRFASWRCCHLSVLFQVPDRVRGTPTNLAFHANVTVDQHEVEQRNRLQYRQRPIVVPDVVLVRCVMRAMRHVVEHELEEAFHFGEARIFDPHGAAEVAEVAIAREKANGRPKEKAAPGWGKRLPPASMYDGGTVASPTAAAFTYDDLLAVTKELEREALDAAVRGRAGLAGESDQEDDDDEVPPTLVVERRPAGRGDDRRRRDRELLNSGLLGAAVELLSGSWRGDPQAPAGANEPLGRPDPLPPADPGLPPAPGEGDRPDGPPAPPGPGNMD